MRRRAVPLPNHTIRLAAPGDARGCLAIYQPVVESSRASFEIEPPDVAEFAERIATILTNWPWLVAAGPDGAIAGYAHATYHRGRRAYRWCTEVSAYVAAAQHRQGVGRWLYRTLFACLRIQGFYYAYAGIVLPNDRSVAFHRTMGFVPVGTYADIGFKLGAWHSVSWWHLRLQQAAGTPSPPRELWSCRKEIARVLAESPD